MGFIYTLDAYQSCVISGKLSDKANSMLKDPIRVIADVMVFIMMLLIPACSSTTPRDQVVVYTSVGQVYSEPILDEFEKETGIEVLAVYDVEAAKTTGLVNRLIAEQGNPRADVWWNSEIIQTLALKERGLLASYPPTAAKTIPESYRDPEGYWTGVAGRARVILVNTNCITDPTNIRSIYDLIDPVWDGDLIGIANPLFGTTATHAAALYSHLGPQAGREYF